MVQHMVFVANRRTRGIQVVSRRAVVTFDAGNCRHSLVDAEETMDGDNSGSPTFRQAIRAEIHPVDHPCATHGPNVSVLFRAREG